MGAQFSGVDNLNKNVHLTRLVDTEHIDENDPFWNQLSSFAFDLPLTKYESYFILFLFFVRVYQG